ncbi:DNA cytosine methyltransferase [Streptococcus sp. sy010]|uniref:DNA cytosine methyltransferase n=1 Tax=Streptococcus sp. sy010 TaxID=2600148 RepID=UPI0011B3C5A6|nr:DNA cytosine methyltransferase [Streptococcus sp. sy010]TWT16472.1 DNA cytosine methyltransferase [Streptococcus sp. sy010]
MQFNILDLFSGAGGFSKGFDQIKNFKTVVATDFNKEALETFAYNFPDTDLIYGDITNKDIKKQILKIARSRQVNMIIGGPPCQGFSNKGKQLGLEDPRNFLFLEYLEIVKEIQPEIFVIENVKTMLTAVNGYFLEQIKKKITSLGYFIDYGVMVASDYGVPQKRERAIIIASKYKNIYLPIPEMKYNHIVTVRDAISDLNYLNSGEGQKEMSYINEPESNYQRLMRKKSKKLYNHVATNHSLQALEKLKMIPSEKGKEYLPKELWGKQKFKTTWGRLVWDEQSPTIDTRFDTPSNGKNSHPVLHRAITPREAARIQSFPDDFVFLGNKTQITKQIGNAVPPLMATAIAKSIREQMLADEL